MYYVYELVNLLGTVEHVGQTIRPKVRFAEHTRTKPGPKHWHGKFYGRQDISMHIVTIYATKAEALQAEFDLQIFWGLPPDRKKASRAGSEHGNAKLEEDQVRQIKNLLAQKISGLEIAKRYSVKQSCIYHIKSGKNWAHVK